MSFFNNARYVAINGGSFSSVGQSGMDRLIKASNSHALHNSSARFDPPKCHPGTRSFILEYIMQWIFGSSDRDSLILWLYGSAGAGKSAILQTIAEKCAELNILLASFFFSRSEETRNHPGSLVATIAYQIRQKIPQIAVTLDAIIDRDPMIFDKTLDEQIYALIVEPLQSLGRSGSFAYLKCSPRLILIDGLDECNDRHHRRTVLRAVARAIHEHGLPFLFLISSRPEADIRMAFNSDMVGLGHSQALDDDYRTEIDIRLFLGDQFQYIKKMHPMKEHIPPTWPDSSVIDKIVRKSSCHFIYPSTVIKYISVIQASPVRQLDVILGLQPARVADIPFAAIDALYMQILSSAEDRQLMLDVLALLMGYFDFGHTGSSLNISWFLGVDPVDVDLVLSSLVSITQYNSDSSVHISHASLSDFLSDQKRSGDFYIDRIHYSEKLVHQGIKQICSKSGVDLKLFGAVFSSTSYRPMQMTEEFFQDLESLPLDLIWNAVEQDYANNDLTFGIPKDIYWLEMFDWLGGILNGAKSRYDDISTYRDPRYQEICLKYAMRIASQTAAQFQFHLPLGPDQYSYHAYPVNHLDLLIHIPA